MAKKLSSKIRRAISRQRDSEKTEKTYSPRHLARSVAKANMRRACIPHINRNFRANWRDWVIVKDKRAYAGKRNRK